MTVQTRVVEPRRAAALARHYREQEGLSIAEIARRLGRAEATVKAYLYDLSHANKRPTGNPTTMPPLDTLPAPRCSSSRRLGLGAPRAYLILAAVSVVIKVVELAIAGCASPGPRLQASS